MADPGPTFSQSAIEAVEIKFENPSIVLMVSIEPEPGLFDPLWKDPLLLSALNSSYLIVRLYTSVDGFEISQFCELYPVSSFPALLVFGPGTEEITKCWMGGLPGPQILYDFCLALMDKSPMDRKRATRSGPPRSARISVQSGGRNIVREFKPDAPLREVRDWIESEFGSGSWKITVAHAHKQLPDDDSLTVNAADLVPSAVLKLEGASPVLREDPNLLALTRTETEEIPLGTEEAVRMGRRGGCLWLNKIIGWLNPFPGIVEVEDFFMTKE
jgi:hypothetical protein